jgi:Holliday junction resolvase
MNNDMFIEDIDNNKESKRINCSVKGKSNEREIVKILNKRFVDILSKNTDWGLFSRTIGSGSRFFQVNLSNNAKQVFSSDISCPPSFNFTIESKAGYDIDLCSAFEGHRQLDEFLEQVTKDGEKSGKQPLLLWKKDRRPRLAFIHSDQLKTDYVYSMKYRNWTVITLSELIKQPDDFFFNI